VHAPAPPRKAAVSTPRRCPPSVGAAPWGTLALVNGANLHTYIFTRLVKAQFDDFVPKTLADLAAIWPPRGLDVEHVETLQLDVGVDDLEEAGLTPISRQLLRLVHQLPRTDPRVPYASIDAAQRELYDIFADRLGNNRDQWLEPTSDAAIVLLVTQGLAAHLLEKGHEARTYVVDLSYMSELSVRAGFVRYGAKLVLELDAHDALEPRSITWARGTSEPGEDGWEEAKFAFRVSVATAVTVADHAVKCHFLASNAMVVATRTQLPSAHPVRSLLRPFQFRTPAINSGALVTLIPPRAIFHRLFAFEWEGLAGLYARAKAEFRWETVPQSLGRRGVMDLPGYAFAEDALALWHVERQLSGEYLDAIGFEPAGDAPIEAFRRELVRVLPATAGVPELRDRAALADALAVAIFNATGFHEQAGGAIGDYLARPDFVVPTMVDGPVLSAMLPSKNTMIQGYMLGVLTNFKMPRITDDFSSLVPEAAAGVVRRWIGRLQALAREVDARNATRAQPFYTFHPDRLEISVSI
jgi:hypothetical protein